MRASLRQVPRPLLLVLAATALFGVAWAVIVPAWGNPDEDAHFSYTQTLVEREELPGRGAEPVSREQRVSMDYTNTDETTVFSDARPEWSEIVEEEWRGRQHTAARDNGGGTNAIVQYPPAYYMYEAVPYALTRDGDIFSRAYAMRLFSLLWLLVTTAAAWLLAGEVFGLNRPLQVVTAAGVGLWPMLSFISASINPDAMVIALWALSTWLATSLMRRGASAGRAAALCLCVGLALVTKASALALLPPAVFALVVVAVRAARRLSFRRIATAAAVVACLAAPVGIWFAVAETSGREAYGQAELISDTGSPAGVEDPDAAREVTTSGTRSPSVREFGSYLWQFYLPKLPFQNEIRFMFPVFSELPIYQVWLAGGWANFGWSNVWFPSGVYLVFLGATILVLVGAGLTAGRALRGKAWNQQRTLLMGSLFALTAAALLAGLHWTDFRMYLRDDPPFLQGRYLLPLAPLFALVLAQATRALPVRFRSAGQGAVLAGLVVLQLGCLGLVASRFYG
jgi:4-amino-4-deoxy-L-arabinose transferase-like glycosyltransferase